MNEEVFQEYITTSDAAKILNVSIYRIHQFLHHPCPDCGRTEYKTVGDEIIIDQIYKEGGCAYCGGSGMRLPTYGKFKNGGWMLRKEDVEKLIDRRAGYPKGRKRRPKVRR